MASYNNEQILESLDTSTFVVLNGVKNARANMQAVDKNESYRKRRLCTSDYCQGEGKCDFFHLKEGCCHLSKHLCPHSTTFLPSSTSASTSVSTSSSNLSLASSFSRRSSVSTSSPLISPALSRRGSNGSTSSSSSSYAPSHASSQRNSRSTSPELLPLPSPSSLSLSGGVSSTPLRADSHSFVGTIRPQVHSHHPYSISARGVSPRHTAQLPLNSLNHVNKPRVPPMFNNGFSNNNMYYDQKPPYNNGGGISSSYHHTHNRPPIHGPYDSYVNQTHPSYINYPINPTGPARFGHISNPQGSPVFRPTQVY